MLLCAGVAMALLLLFAFANHRRGEHRPRFVVIQATALIPLLRLPRLASPGLAVASRASRVHCQHCRHAKAPGSPERPSPEHFESWQCWQCWQSWQCLQSFR